MIICVNNIYSFYYVTLYSVRVELLNESSEPEYEVFEFGSFSKRVEPSSARLINEHKIELELGSFIKLTEPSLTHLT